jgi:hypothetical protein
LEFCPSFTTQAGIWQAMRKSKLALALQLTEHIDFTKSLH